MNIVEFILDSQQQLSCHTMSLSCDDGKYLEVMTAMFYFRVLCSLHHLMHMDPHISYFILKCLHMLVVWLSDEHNPS